uniref:Uncharacterized protein n=1 Tax=Romanomermis culicivorax TaxID=13658 RepID=A0A915HH08_ROMCU
MDNAYPRSEEIDVATAQMIAVDDQPFSVVENSGFINLIKKARDKTRNENYYSLNRFRAFLVYRSPESIKRFFKR